MASILKKIRRLSNQWRKNHRQDEEPKSPSSIADFPASIEFLADEQIAAQIAVPDLAGAQDVQEVSLSTTSQNEAPVPDELEHAPLPELPLAEHPAQEHESVNEVIPEDPPKHRNLVSICKGKHKGKQGEIVGIFDKRTYRIRLVTNDQEGDIVSVRMTSVVGDEDINVDDLRRSVDSSPTAATATTLPVFQDVTDLQWTSKRWIGLRVRDRATGAIGMVDNAVGEQTVLFRPDDRNSSLRVSTHELTPLKAGTILPRDKPSLVMNENQKVRIICGKHSNKTATIVGNGSRRDLVRVQLNGKIFNVKRTSVIESDIQTTAVQEHRMPLQELSLGITLDGNRNAQPPIRSTSTSIDKTIMSPERHVENMITSENSPNQQVRICAGKHFSKLAVLLGDGPKKNLVRVLVDGKEYNVARLSIEFDVTKTLVRQKPGSLQSVGKATRSSRQQRVLIDAVPDQQEPVWTLPNTENTNIESFGGRRTRRIRVDENPTPEVTMLNTLFGDRLFYVDVVLNGRQNQKALDATVYHHDVKYELVSARLTDDDTGGRYSKKKVLICGYAAVQGPNISSLSLSDELLRIGDFSRLPPRKIASRLELFLSPARFNVYFAKGEDFCQIPETGNVGCGFISEEKLLAICLNGKMGKTKASRVVAIQVRIFFPHMGIYKGVLVKKRKTQSPIELPPSMLKVPASTHENAWSGAAIVVCKNGVHQSAGSANEYIGRALNNSLNEPPQKSFEQKIQKELKDMILRLWLSMGVPRGICHNYIKESVKMDRRNHAWLVGVADPTGCLPSDSVYVPGFKTLHPEKVFVTRSPCVKFEDGRVLEHICTQPSLMSNEDWESLNSMSFGCIVFSNPRQGMVSIPERIALGDLDGDLYLVCWDEEVLYHMNDVAQLIATPQTDDGELSTIASDCGWLQKTHSLMQDVGSLNGLGKLTGKLYTLGEKVADSSTEGLKDADAIAFFDAYNQALEYKKHGRPIVLPRHLHAKVPKELRSLLDDTE